MNPTLKRCTALLHVLVLLSASSTAVFSQQLSETINIIQQSRQFANGYTTLPRLIKVTRPAEGLYIKGVVRVKTRAVHGFHKNDNVINGSAANTLLSQFDMRSVSSSFLTQSNSNTADISIEQTIGLDRIYDVKYSDAIEPFDLCLRLMQSPDVEYAVPVQIHKADFIPNDPRYAEQTWLKQLSLEKAWDISKGGKSVLIAIIDSGTDYTHEDLSAQIFTNTNEIPNNNTDDDGNGFIDDVRGWDFVGSISLTQAQAGQYLPDNDPKVNWAQITGVNGHGTLTAGCASATTNNSKGIASPGFNCTIIPIKVASDNPQVSAILRGYEAIKYAADLGAHIINCSWGGPGADPAAQDIIDYATAKGALVVASSGNAGINSDDTPFSPSGLDGVLAVGSTGPNGNPSNFSNYGWNVEVLAPGENILSTFPGNSYQKQTGTSFSSPLTAGIAALIKAVHSDWTPGMIKQQIRSTSDVPTGVSAANRPLYYGKVNAEKALRYNTSFSSGDRIPGITITNVIIENGRIKNYDPTRVTITLKNLLGDAPQTIVSIEPRSGGATVTPDGNQQIGTMLHNDTQDIILTIQLTENFPWFDANIELAITIQSGSYTDYALVKIPVTLPSSNVFIGVPVQSSSFNTIDYSPSGRALWSTGILFGSLTGFITGNLAGGQAWGGTPYLADVVKSINNTTALISGTLQGEPAISLTTNLGQNWTNVNVSSYMKSVEGIVMFDSANGLAVGNPSSNRIGIVKTTNGGSSWSALSNAPVSGGTETVRAGTVFNLGNSVWFATSNNRILYTTDAGSTWNAGSLNASGAVVISMAFRDQSNGILLYKTSSSQTAPIKIASTNNGGKNWTANVFDPSTLGIRAKFVASPGRHHLLVGEIGEVFGSGDNGSSWQIILSRPPGIVEAGMAVSGDNGVLFMAGSIVSILQYKYNNPFGTKILAFDSDTIDYGTLNTGQNRQRFISISSSGESDVTVDSTIIVTGPGTPTDAFRIATQPDTIVESGSKDQFGVRCFATDIGTYRATLKIYSNATPSVTSTELVAKVQSATSVDEINEFNISISPNPAFDNVTVVSEVGGTLSLFETTGRLIGSWQIADGLPLIISLTDKPSGMYQVVITGRDKRSVYPLRIVK